MSSLADQEEYLAEILDNPAVVAEFRKKVKEGQQQKQEELGPWKAYRKPKDEPVQENKSKRNNKNNEVTGEKDSLLFSDFASSWLLFFLFT